MASFIAGLQGKPVVLFVPEGVNDDSLQDICSLMAEGKICFCYMNFSQRMSRCHGINIFMLAAVFAIIGNIRPSSSVQPLDRLRRSLRKPSEIFGKLLDS